MDVFGCVVCVFELYVEVEDFCSALDSFSGEGVVADEGEGGDVDLLGPVFLSEVEEGFGIEVVGVDVVEDDWEVGVDVSDVAETGCGQGVAVFGFCYVSVGEEVECVACEGSFAAVGFAVYVEAGQVFVEVDALFSVYGGVFVDEWSPEEPD